MFKKRLRQAGALLCCLAVVLSQGMMAVHADELDDLRAEKDKLRAEQAAVQKELDSVRADKKDQLTYLATINRKIATIEKSIKNAKATIQLREADIAARNAEIDAYQFQIEQNFDLFKERLREMYMESASGTVLGLLLSSTSFTDFLLSAEVVRRMSESDNALIDQLSADKAAVEAIMIDLQQKKADLEAEKQELEQDKKELEDLKKEANAVLNTLTEKEKETRKRVEKLTAELVKNQAEINAIVALKSDLLEYVGGDYMWPMPGWTMANISSGYGGRYVSGVYNFHSGMDIAGVGAISGVPIKNQPFYAANSGKVVYVRSYSYGYGNHLLIDHGGGNFTLYAHASSIAVREGDWVNRGQHIGNVGSTGWSTGYHLHFEVWVNKQHTNPANYSYSQT